MPGEKKVSVFMTPELREALAELARADGRNVARYIERLLIAHVERKSKATATRQ